MLNFEMLKNLALVPASLFEKRISGTSKAALRSEVGPMVQEKLGSKFQDEVINGLKIVISVFNEGEDVSGLLPRIINLLQNDNEEVKRLSHYLVSEISKVVVDKNPLILSISSLHKEVLNAKGIHRGNAIKSLSSIMLNAPDMLHVLIPTLNKMALDKNAYVRKVCVLSWLKIACSDIPEDEFDKEQILSTLQRHLFKDIPYVMGPALVAYEAISGDKTFEFLHGTYRRICKELLKMNPYDRSLVLEMLHKYAFLYLSDVKKEKKNKLYTDEDLNALCTALDRLVLTQDFVSIIQASKIVLFLEDENLTKKYVSALIKMLNKTSETKYQALLALEQYAIKYPKLVSPHYKKFFVFHLEKMYCKLMKLRILHEITEDWNFSDIFSEFCSYVTYHSTELTTSTLINIGKLALKCPRQSLKCVKYLMSNILGKNSLLASKSIIALSEYLQNMSSEKIPALAFCVNNITKIESEDAKLKLINLLIQNVDSLKNIALRVFHSLVIEFKSLGSLLKLRTIELGCTLLPIHKNSEPFMKTFNLALEMGNFDEQIMLRDYSKFLKKVLERDGSSQRMQINIRKVLNTFKKDIDESYDKQLGSLSDLVGYKIKGFKDFPKNEDIVHTSTVDLREKVADEQETTQKKASAQVEKSAAAENPVSGEEEEVSSVVLEEKQKDVVEPEVKKEEFIIYDKNLESLNDDFFDEP